MELTANLHLFTVSLNKLMSHNLRWTTLSKNRDGLIVTSVCGGRLLPVVETRPADRPRRRNHRRSISPRHQLACVGVSLAATLSPNTFLRILISSCFRPSARSSLLTRRFCSSSGRSPLSYTSQVPSFRGVQYKSAPDKKQA